ncbi:hypothetical protein [Streptomyces sp. NPDC058426]|uniref:hypothetical protein n=1 Tax=Streptomyces sp. NPDC058426 TaxID=3346493 RepID=UPI00366901F2
MSAPGAAGTAAESTEPEAPAEEKTAEAAAEETAAPERPQDAWSARRDLADHAPAGMRAEVRSRFGGGLVGGDQHGVSGGRVSGDVVMGGKNVYHFGMSSAPASGTVPAETLERLAAVFVCDEERFARLTAVLRRERVLVLSGPPLSGRRTAALMLLREVGAVPVHALARDTKPERFAEVVQPRTEEADRKAQPRGYFIDGLVPTRDHPVREPHLLALRDSLAEAGAYLVLTVEPDIPLEDVVSHAWTPPAERAVLRVHLSRMLKGDDDEAEELAEARVTALLDHPSVPALLAGPHQLREVVAFAHRLAAHATGTDPEGSLADFGDGLVTAQAREWFAEDEEGLPLREKAFLLALAVFDGGPYALAAELSDRLHARLQRVEDPTRPARVPVFGTHLDHRLARARSYAEEIATEWGPVLQRNAAFHHASTAGILLAEAWTSHPSARPALVGWLNELAADGRPLVRTRVASATALLARADLPSAIALLIEEWADSDHYRRRLVAAQALALTHLLGVPNVRILLEDWVSDPRPQRRWVAIRTLGVTGPEQPLATLAALRRAIRAEYADESPEQEMLGELAEAVELLALSPAHEAVLGDLLRTVTEPREGHQVHEVVLAGFLRACGHTTDDRPQGPPLLLAHFAKALTGDRARSHELPGLWQAALARPASRAEALRVLREWVLAAARDEFVEWSLAALLPRLIGSHDDAERLRHLLRTMPGEDATPAPAVAGRLLTVLLPRPATSPA